MALYLLVLLFMSHCRQTVTQVQSINVSSIISPFVVGNDTLIVQSS